MDRIDAATLDRLPLARIDSVTFFKRDELTTDLICCEVGVDGWTWFFHEEVEGWDLLLRHLERLPGFRADWYGAVAQPAFERCETVAFERRK
ncbi:MAG TPA: hypothetical protein VE053_02715 [Allosphingosinicella sp.]|nr:hypothetical protein [Allosphingosinicella sp.]